MGHDSPRSPHRLTSQHHAITGTRNRYNPLGPTRLSTIIRLRATRPLILNRLPVSQILNPRFGIGRLPGTRISVRNSRLLPIGTR